MANAIPDIEPPERIQMPFKCVFHTHARINLGVWPTATRLPSCFFHPKSKNKTSFRSGATQSPPPSGFNTFQIDFSSHINRMKCANQRLQIDIVLRLSSSAEREREKKRVKFAIRHTCAPKSIEITYRRLFRLSPLPISYCCCDCKSRFSLFPLFLGANSEKKNTAK